MKTSIRSRKFTIGMVLFLVIILLLSVSSAFYLNKLSGKTSAILKENHYSVVYARNMSERLIYINQDLIKSLLKGSNPDTSTINLAFNQFENSLKLEKNNITEIGEDKLALSIDNYYIKYKSEVIAYIKRPKQADKVAELQLSFEYLNQQLMKLSQMNENAIEEKTNDAKLSAKKATLQMTFIGTICFLIAYGYTFIFASYFNERFYTLYNGVKEVKSSNYKHRFTINGDDELSEMAILVNEMANKINKIDPDLIETIGKQPKKVIEFEEIEKLKGAIAKMRALEEEANNIISRIENKSKK